MAGNTGGAAGSRPLTDEERVAIDRAIREYASQNGLDAGPADRPLDPALLEELLRRYSDAGPADQPVDPAVLEELLRRYREGTL